MIYTIATDKGGTAKTTTAAAIAQAATYKGRKALAIDLDPQGNLTYCLAADARAAGAYELLHGTPAADVIQKSPQGMDVISASRDLRTEKSAAGSARRLQEALEPIRRKYGVIVIDTPATAGELQYNALMAADRLVIALEADTFSVQALYQIIDTAEQIKQSNPRLKIAGVMLARYEGNTNLNKYLRGQIEETAKALHIPYLGEARKYNDIKAAISFQQSLFDYAPNSKGAADYMAIYENLK
jgi:chromosome partitioning protein